MSGGGAPALVHATTVRAYEYIQGKAIDKGRLGLAILGSPFAQEYKLVLYVSKQQYVAQVAIVSSFAFNVTTNNYVTFHDDHRRSWSVLFDSQDAMFDFAKQVVVAKTNLQSKRDFALLQDLVIGDELVSQANDTIECKYKVWQLTDYKIGKMLDGNIGSDAILSLQLGRGKDTMGLEKALVDMKENGRRFIAVSSSLAYGSAGLPKKIPADATLFYEVELLKVKNAVKRASAKSKAKVVKARQARESDSRKRDSVSESLKEGGESSSMDAKKIPLDVSSGSLDSENVYTAENGEGQATTPIQVKQKPPPVAKKPQSGSLGSLATCSPTKRDLASSLLDGDDSDDNGSLSSLDAEETKAETIELSPKKSAPIPVKPKPVVAKKRRPTAQSVDTSSSQSSSLPDLPSPTPEKKSVDSIKAQLAKQSYLGSPSKTRKAPYKVAKEGSVATLEGAISLGSYISFICKDGSRLYGTVQWIGNHPTKPDKELVGLLLDNPREDGNDGSIKGRRMFKCAPNSGAFIKLENCTLLARPSGDGQESPFIVSAGDGDSNRLKSALAKLGEAEKENGWLRLELQQSRAHFQQQMDAAREKFEKKKQALREKDEEIEEIKELARQRVKEKIDKVKQELEQVKGQNLRVEGRYRSEIANLKGKLDASESPGGSTSVTGNSNAGGGLIVMLTEDEVRIPEAPKRVSGGQFGVVHMASFRGCPVAVELIETATVSSYTEELFTAEAQQAAIVRHPNILLLIGFVFTRNHPVVVTELYESTVRELLVKRSLDKGEIVRIACDVAKALNYLHLAKPSPVVHGNVCSLSIVLMSPQNFRAKLVHSGVAAFAAKSQTFSLPHIGPYTRPGSGRQPIDDCYSFGVLMCEMCTRRLPLPDQREKQVASISHKTIREIVVYTLGKDSKRGQPTMNGVIDFLRKVLLG
eukprot:m.19625 g.19625  ORF g.19625 m.19625 type:complete len:926 (+) comp27874_c0_seq2:95-2872(+)